MRDRRRGERRRPRTEICGIASGPRVILLIVFDGVIGLDQGVGEATGLPFSITNTAITLVGFDEVFLAL